MNCEPMVALIAFSWTNYSSYVRINTIKILEKKFNVCLKDIKLKKHRVISYVSKFKVEGDVEWSNVN